MLASLTSPNSSRDQLLCYILWMALVYTIDDIRDRFLIDDEDSISTHAVRLFTCLCQGNPWNLAKISENPKVCYFLPQNILLRSANNFLSS